MLDELAERGQIERSHTMNIRKLALGAIAATGTTAGSGVRMDTPSASPGAFKPNEDPAHEATESAAREAQENAG